MIVEGEVKMKGKKITGHEMLTQKNWEMIRLKSKEGLALPNGTQFMSSYGTYILLKAKKLSYLADVIGAVSLEGFDGRIDPFNKLIHLVRPHKGQVTTAAFMTEILTGSELIQQDRKSTRLNSSHV